MLVGYMNYYIKDYDSVYDEQLDLLDDNYWGENSGTKKVSEDINDDDIFKIALINNELVGFLHFKQIGDMIDCYHILVKEDYQKHNIASNLMTQAMIEINNRDVKNLIAHAVMHDGNINAKKLLEKFGFKEIYRVNNYWNSLYPGEFCKQCNSNNCHCGVVVYLKSLD